MQELRVILTIGCPGSGKSYWAHSFMKKNFTNFVVVNKDSLREMNHKYWVPSRERLIVEWEFNCAKLALQNNYNVIIDSTNLNPKTINRWKELIKQLNDEDSSKLVTVEYKEFKLPLWRLYLNDLRRKLTGGRSVGFKVIKQFYNKYYANNKNTEKPQ